MKINNKISGVLFSAILGMGIVGGLAPITSYAAPKIPYENKNCESGCNADRSRSQIKRYFVNFPTTTKDKISYYENTTDPKNSQQGPLINPNRFAYYTSSKKAGEYDLSKAPFIDLSNIMNDIRAGGELKIELTLTHGEFEIPTSEMNFNQDNQLKFAELIPLITGPSQDNYAKISDFKDARKTRVMDNTKNGWSSSIIKTNSITVVSDVMNPNKMNNFVIQMPKLKILLPEKYPISKKELVNDPFAFSNDNNVKVKAKITFGGDLKYEGTLYEIFNGYFNSESDQDTQTAFSRNFKTLFKFDSFDREGTFPEHMSKERIEGKYMNIAIFDGARPTDASATQDIKATLESGGITGGINSTNVDSDLKANNVDFGSIQIGADIPNKHIDKMITVRDWTGGAGWKLTAKNSNVNKDASLQFGVVVNDKSVALNDQEQSVVNGRSQLTPFEYSGDYTATWNESPKVGKFNNVIEWNLTANITE